MSILNKLKKVPALVSGNISITLALFELVFAVYIYEKSMYLLEACNDGAGADCQGKTSEITTANLMLSVVALIILGLEVLFYNPNKMKLALSKGNQYNEALADKDLQRRRVNIDASQFPDLSPVKLSLPQTARSPFRVGAGIASLVFVGALIAAEYADIELGLNLLIVYLAMLTHLTVGTWSSYETSRMQSKLVERERGLHLTAKKLYKRASESDEETAVRIAAITKTFAGEKDIKAYRRLHRELGELVDAKVLGEDVAGADPRQMHSEMEVPLQGVMAAAASVVGFFKRRYLSNKISPLTSHDLEAVVVEPSRSPAALPLPNGSQPTKKIQVQPALELDQKALSPAGSDAGYDSADSSVVASGSVDDSAPRRQGDPRLPTFVSVAP